MGAVGTTIVDRLKAHHERLSKRFSAVFDERSRLANGSPVFALEHGFSAEDLADLFKDVRSAVAAGFGLKYRAWWLPFVVYAAEFGYRYDGQKFWPTFEKETPGWADLDQREWFRYKFKAFVSDFGGIEPTGKFADQSNIIAWPIANAILPTDLQDDLAHLLFHYRNALTADLLSAPEELGRRLSLRAGPPYNERFQIFCQNTSLLGHIAAALLSGEDEPSPYLCVEASERILADLSLKQKSRDFLVSARDTAVRVRTRGGVARTVIEESPTDAFDKSDTLGEADKTPAEKNTLDRKDAVTEAPARLAPTDAKLFLKRVGGIWQLHVALPDLTPLKAYSAAVYDELNSCRARLEGCDSHHLPRTQLLRTGQEQRLTRWPRPAIPLIQLEGGSDAVNQVLAERCRVTPGPIWLFKRRRLGFATELKGRVLRPNMSYLAVVADGSELPNESWIREARLDIDATGIRLYELTVPPQLSADDLVWLKQAGFKVVVDIAIRPVGIVASSWDGEGFVEWPAGEPVMLGIQSQIGIAECKLELDGRQSSINWPLGSQELLLLLEQLEVGAHDLDISLLGGDGSVLAGERVSLTVLDPQVRPDGAAPGEGIRLMASPARPSLSDLFDQRAQISIEGPSGFEADVSLTLLAGDGSTLVSISKKLPLPQTTSSWSAFIAALRQDQGFVAKYDEAEKAIISVQRAGVGFARLQCDRGYRPLQWRISREKDKGFKVRLADQTDGQSTTVRLYTVAQPIDPEYLNPSTEVSVPPQGGLLEAVCPNYSELLILPTQPNVIFAEGFAKPNVVIPNGSPDDLLRLVRVHSLWASADLPGDVFAQRQQWAVLTVLTSYLVGRLGGSHWRQIETRFADADTLRIRRGLREIQQAVGVADWQVAIASDLAERIPAWTTPRDAARGYYEAVRSELSKAGFDDQIVVAVYFLNLVTQPGRVLDRQQDDLHQLMQLTAQSPFFVRAARFVAFGFQASNSVMLEIEEIA